jgi:hypothetical protein
MAIMTVLQHLESARNTLEDILAIAKDHDLKSYLARAYADISIAISQLTKQAS